ncbi:MAG: hypothetical protein H6623_08730 [Bdellovibrionaceae bacterium]|nr:hypothetical protein [Pseudobdellovibrionaceae bacterium]
MYKWIKIAILTVLQVSASASFAQTSTSSTNPTPIAATESQETIDQQGLAAPAKPVVLSFMEWKSLRVHEAQQKLEQMAKTQEGAPVWHEGKAAADAKGAEQRLNFNVDVALQLNIQDYFSMYLKNLSKEEFKEATKKLNQEEVAELLLAYKNSQDKGKTSPQLKFSSTNKDNAKSKNTEI